MGGAPLVLPSWLDAISDRWWGLTPRVRTTVVAVLLLALAASSAVRVVSSPYGPPVPLLVAAEDLAPGTVLDDTVLRPARWPGELAPSGARTDPTGTLTAPLPAGAVLTDGHVTDRGLGGVVGPGMVAVPLPAELVPALEVGAAVQVIASAMDGAGLVLADQAEVLALDGTSMWLAVPAAAAADVAAAGLRGTIALAVVPAAARDGP
ncbi:SAF domain-containing protein [Nitriliruptor alkaliphilus]|uniref:SAF domain-containing protein n=1 Tax=Nitriliruptor alkaliphilus TaxID=427918 RepID=UPI0006962614|nr:SAF domain-containing protein [Nitriliruptor alkaliphilus]